METQKFKLVIADDHPLLLEGMVSILQKEFPFANIFKAENGQIALDRIQEINPEIAVLDIDMPKLTGLEVAKKLNTLKLKTKIIFLTLHKEESLFEEAQNLNVNGYILKEFSTDEIVKCIREVLQNKQYYSKQLEKFILKSTFDFSLFTKKEANVLKLIAQHKTTKEIADLLFVSTRTIDSHRYHICKKLDLKPEKNSLLKWVLKQGF